MIARRHLLGNTLFGGLFAMASASAPPPGVDGQITERQAQDLVDALKGLRTALETPQSFSEITRLRQLQLDFLKSSGKFPDFIDAGADVWFALHDWHIKHLVPVNLGRDASGRYTIMLLTTAIVLRPDILPTFVGLPYDNK